MGAFGHKWVCVPEPRGGRFIKRCADCEAERSNHITTPAPLWKMDCERFAASFHGKLVRENLTTHKDIKWAQLARNRLLEPGEMVA
jgi:hypothetical protein